MIGILVFPDFQLLDAAGPISVFEIAARYAAQSPSIKVIAEIPGAVRSSSGVEMVARGFKPAGAISTLIVAGGDGVDLAAKSENTLAFVRASPGAASASPASARALTSWPKPDYWTAAAPPRTGGARGIFYPPIPR
jgi:transcriptional regulator GlxA family with amidase domain